MSTDVAKTRQKRLERSECGEWGEQGIDWSAEQKMSEFLWLADSQERLLRFIFPSVP